MAVLSRDLNLRFGNFFNKDPGNWIPACVGVITSTDSGTITNPETHAHLAFVDVVAVPLNMTDAMDTFSTSFPHVHNTVNWKGAWTLSTVESEIPAFTATVTAADFEIASPVNMERCVREVFEEHAVLWKKKWQNIPKKALILIMIFWFFTLIFYRFERNQGKGSGT